MSYWFLKNPIQAIFIVWMFFYAMMGIHELGHILLAWTTGGIVTKVVWIPWAISRTDVNPNPSPLLVAWGGAIVGTLLPLTVYGILEAIKSGPRVLVGFFAAFCCLANGLYLGLGWVDQVGDCRELLAYGASVQQLAGFGAILFLIGLGLLDHMDRHLISKRNSNQIQPKRSEE